MRTFTQGHYPTAERAQLVCDHVNKWMNLPTQGKVIKEDGSEPQYEHLRFWEDRAYVLDFGTMIHQYSTTIDKLRQCITDFEAGYYAGSGILLWDSKTA